MNTRWFGIHLLRYARLPGGPLVWSLTVRLGRRKELKVIYR